MVAKNKKKAVTEPLDGESAEVIFFPVKPEAGSDYQGAKHITQYNTENTETTNSAKKGKGRPPTHGLSGTPTYESFKAAKARCSNPKLAQFKDYGGRGIEFRFGSIIDLVEAIGERPDGKTLDRIDTNGHYEAGNVKWSTPVEQAKNRRPATYYQKQAIEARWYREREPRTLWLNTARFWSLSVVLFNRHGLPERAMAELMQFREGCSLPNATFPLDELWNWCDPNPGYILLPSITNPGGRVILRGGPFGGMRRSSHNGRGYISGFVHVPLRLNCTEQERVIVEEFVNGYRLGGGAGLCYHGGNMLYSPAPIEGRLMAIAARIAKIDWKVRVVPVAEAAADLLADNTEHLTDSSCLVIPDLHVHGAEGFGLDRLSRYLVLKMLRERLNNRLPTIVHVANPIELGQEFASFLEFNYRMVDLDALPALKHPDPVAPVWGAEAEE